MKEALSTEKFIIECFTCGKDMTEQADRDGRAEELKDVALYLCKDCAFAERKKEEKIGDYLLLKELDLGRDMEVVHKAWHKLTGKVVIIKEIADNFLSAHRKGLRLFHREIKVTKELLHPNIVRFYDSFTRGGKPYLVTEYLPGGSAQDMLLRQEEPLPFDKACHIILEVLEGLSYAHKKGIVHSDISLENVLFDKEGRAKLFYTVLAKSFEVIEELDIEDPGEPVGSLLYMAPEQILNCRFVKPPADVYSVGVCLYYLITGKFPYHFPSRSDVLLDIAGSKKVKAPLQIILEDDPIPILERKPDLPKPLATVIDRCLRKRPEERFKDAGELKKEIEKALN
jgi:serine/threonine-protein kinase